MGSSTTAFPGRAATGRGFIVLTVDETSGAVDISRDRSNEAPRVIDGYRTAICSLAENGLIDATKVGAIGWSRTSYYVKYAVTHAPELFAAVVAVDGVDYGLWQYFGWLDMPGRVDLDDEFHQAYGGTPWDRAERWWAEAPIFGVQRVRAPVLGGANSLASTTLLEWEFYAGLRRLNKPADLILYPQGQHVLVHPLHRRYSTQISLDWLDYWINGYRDSDPSKNEQYARWEAMRQEPATDVSANAPAPRGDCGRSPRLITKPLRPVRSRRTAPYSTRARSIIERKSPTLERHRRH